MNKGENFICRLLKEQDDLARSVPEGVKRALRREDYFTRTIRPPSGAFTGVMARI